MLPSWGQHEWPACLFDRGRSCSYDPLCLCRRAAALCIGADVSWVLRHLETWRNPSDEGSRRVPRFGRVRLVRSSAQPLAPRHVSGVLGVQVRVNPEPADSAKPAQSRSRRARAVFELCHGVPWLSAPTRRRGSHVAPSCDLNTALLKPKRTSAVLSLISSGRIWYLHVESGVYKWSSESVASLSRIVSACSRHWILFTLKLSLPRTCVLLNRALTVLRPPCFFFSVEVRKTGSG